MKSAIVKIEGVAPYSQGRYYMEDVPKLSKELPGAYEERTWRNRMHVSSSGHVEIPGAAFAGALKSAAKRLKIQVPGKQRTEFTKYFEAGVMVPNNVALPIEAADVPGERLFLPSTGQRGGGRRVMKIMPRIDAWSGEVVYYVFDDIITEDVFRQVLVASGQVVGIGRFRPENCGFYGRFVVTSFKWAEEEETLRRMAA